MEKDHIEEFTSTGSRIFSEYKTVGNISNHVPCLLRHIHRRKENFITTCLGKSFATYSGNKLKVLSVSSQSQDDILCMSADTYHVYTGVGKNIFAWRRGTELKHTYEGHEENVVCILPFGEFMVSCDESNFVILWDIKTEEIQWKMPFDFTGDKINGLMHPETYINKILIWTEKGKMILWNIRSNKQIHRFNDMVSGITCVTQAPAVDVVGIALKNYQVILHNIKCDQTLFKLKCNDVPISLAFRTDGQPTLLVGSRVGTITMWDLEKKAVIAYVENAHQGPVAGLVCYPQEPLFASSSDDNSIKLWIFDKPDGSFRLLNSRDGHGQPPNRIRFRDSTNIISAGNDAAFRLFHIYDETYSRCLSKKHSPVNKMDKKPKETAQYDSNQPIVDFTCGSVANPNHYDDLAAIHSNKAAVTTWSIFNTKQNSKVLVRPKTKEFFDMTATCLCMTSCGQFVIVGYDNGYVEKFNIQSHRHQLSYQKHEGSVMGVAVSNENTKTVSGGTDGTIKFFNFKTGAVLKIHQMKSEVTFIFKSRSNNLIGVAQQDFSISVYDMESENLLRIFSNMSDTILDATFSPDAKWITASTGDCLTRTWQLSIDGLIDIFRTESIVHSLDYSPDGDLMAAALSSYIGVLIWVNKTVFAHISILPIPSDYEPPLLGPGLKHFVGKEEENLHVTLYEEEYICPEQITHNFVTMGDSRLEWKNLLNIHLIRERSKPKTQPTTYVAPFFIDNIVESAAEKAAKSSMDDNVTKPDQSGPPSKLAKMSIQLSKFGTLLMKQSKDLEDYSQLREMLKNENNFNVQFEIEALGPDGGGSIDSLNKFMEFLRKTMEIRQCSELVQSWLHLFLMVHEQRILLEKDCHEEMKALAVVCREIYCTADNKLFLSPVIR